MEGNLPMLHSLLQQTLRSLCACSDSSTPPSKWTYAVFWRILPRNYPPPKWDHGGTMLDRAKANKRNWILVWEDGFCDFSTCQSAQNGFGADIFFKLTHEVYNYGEGIVGKVASDNSHKWVLRDSPQENDLSSWNVSVDPQPRAWEAQFRSGIETIALVSVKEGVIQFGSFEKVVEDLNMVLNIQRKLSYIQSIYAIQRPFLPIQNQQMVGFKRRIYEHSDDLPSKSVCLGYTTPQINASGGGRPMWSIPPLLPSLFTTMSSIPVPRYVSDVFESDNIFLKTYDFGHKLEENACISTFDKFRVGLDVKDETGGV